MMHKNLPEDKRNNIIQKRLFLDALAALKYLLGGEAKSMLAVVKAHRGYFEWKKTFNKVEVESRNERSIAGFFNGSVVWQHYIKGKKTFSQIIDGK